MNHLFLRFLILIVMISISSLAFALEQCKDKKAGISFLCDPAWKIKWNAERLHVYIDQTPHVRLIIEQTEQKIHFLSEISRDGLASFGKYAPEFDVIRMDVCGRETIRVDGYLKDDPGIRVRDFYLQDHVQIHIIRFEVQPESEWPKYVGLIDTIVESMQLIQHNERFPLVVKSTGTCEDLLNGAEK